MSRLRLQWSLRVAVLAAVAAVMAGTGLTSVGSADLRQQLTTARAAASHFQGQVGADGRLIAATDHGLADAHARLTSLQNSLNLRVGELRTVQGDLLRSRDRLINLENRLHLATQALSANLVAGYEGAQPNLVTVVLNSHGFGQLLDQVGFLRRVGHQDASIVDITRIARHQVSAEANRLGGLETAHDRTLAETVLGERNGVAALQSALVRAGSRRSARSAPARAPPDASTPSRAESGRSAMSSAFRRPRRERRRCGRRRPVTRTWAGSRSTPPAWCSRPPAPRKL